LSARKATTIRSTRSHYGYQGPSSPTRVLFPKTIFSQVFTDCSLPSLTYLFVDSQTANVHQTVRFVQDLGYHGLRCLQALLALRPLSDGLPSRQILLSAIAFTSSHDKWTNSSCTSIAASILQEHAHEIHSPEFVIEFLLQAVIRPLFSKSRPATITATGRKAMASSAPPRNYNKPDSFDPTLKPWKYTSPFSITVVEWVVENSPVNSNFAYLFTNFSMPKN
jgi:hypothetical protein